jgi:hypothetical protein
MTAIARIDLRPVERRRHQRVKVALLGRYMLRDRREFPCQTLDISPGGVALVAPVQGFVGERVVAYFDHLGRLEGTIARHFQDGFALAVSAPLLKREKLADQLTWLANRNALGLPEDRRHERVRPNTVRTQLQLADGQRFSAKIIDLSVSGVALAVDFKPPVGAAVTVGSTMGRVVRAFDVGVAVEFSRLLPGDAVIEDVEL